jgi:DNA-formamidopyrimidine glycosylase
MRNIFVTSKIDIFTINNYINIINILYYYKLMPEGPEIIITSQYLTTKIKKKKIESIEIIGGRYTHQKLNGYDNLKNFPLTIDKITSKGKFMWMHLHDAKNKKIIMMNTFGMSGLWSFNKEKSARIKFVIISNTVQDKRYELYFIDARNFGTLEFTTDKKVLDKKIENLAPDILRSNMTDNELVDVIKDFIDKSRKNKNLVKVLMDQTAIVSGIGNYLVAEILYEAKLNPHRNLDELTLSEIKKLAHSMRKITKYSYYNNDSGYMEYNLQFMDSHADKVNSGKFEDFHPDIKPNSKFKFKVYQCEQDPYGNPVTRDEIVKDRVIHWVKAIQK